MSFDGWAFLLAFLPAVLTVFLLTCGRTPSIAVAVLPAAAAVFCLLTDPRTLVLLAGSIVANHLLMRVIDRSGAVPWRRRLLTAGGVVMNLLPLVWYKVTNLTALGIMSVAAGEAGALQPIPLGLAFYTLQQITFLVDAQRGDVPRLGFARYSAWASLFCQLPAGPIAPYGAMAGQVARLGLDRPAPRDVACGLSLFVVGLLKKLVLADPLGRTIAPLFDAVETAVISPVEAAAAAWGFMMQLYFNFSAYSDMAIGLALCLGLRLPVNFNSPLKSRSVGEYVQSWHMSLMRFIRDYVFIGIFRLLSRGPGRRMPVGAWATTTIVSYVAMAAWHSPSPAMVGFTVAGAVMLVLLQMLRSAGTGRWGVRGHAVGPGLRAVLGHLFTLAFISGIAVLFRAESFQGAQTLYASLAIGTAADAAGVPPVKLGLLIAGASVIALACPNTMELFGLLPAPAHARVPWWRWRPSPAWGWAIGVAGAAVLLLLSHNGGRQDFVYARF